MSEKRRPVLEQTTSGVLLFWCPGCHQLHGVWSQEPNPVTGAKWTWNGDMYVPTFTPSILVTGLQGGHFRCHSFVREGMIEFCQDSEHRMAGQKIGLPVDPINQI